MSAVTIRSQNLLSKGLRSRITLCRSVEKKRSHHQIPIVSPKAVTVTKPGPSFVATKKYPDLARDRGFHLFPAFFLTGYRSNPADEQAVNNVHF